MIELVNIEATTRLFIEHAMHDRFDDGTFSSYHSTEMTVVSPINFQDKILIIYHAAQDNIEPNWKRQFSRIRFKISKKLLGEGQIVFAAGLIDVEFLEP